MNFQEARNLEGQKNAKGYQMGVSMTGTVQALIDPTRIFTSNGKPTQRIQLLDDLGDSQKVKVFLGNGPDILAADVTTVQSFTDLAMNRYKGNISYMAFWDNMHPPQDQPSTTQLNAATQEIINRHREPSAGQQIQDHMAGKEPRTTKYPEPPIPTTQQVYETKEREKIIGMCMTGHVNARLAVTPPTELLADKAQIAALWQIATMIVDGTGKAQGELNF